MINPISLVILTEENKEAIIQIISKINEIIKRINELDREKNYTIKSPVEEAEEIIINWIQKNDDDEALRKLGVVKKAIQYLKARQI